VPIIFKVENGKKLAYDQNGKHHCSEYEELKRVTSDSSLINAANAVVAAFNLLLRGHRLRLVVEKGREGA
jgi:hypothetical protein